MDVGDKARVFVLTSVLGDLGLMTAQQKLHMAPMPEQWEVLLLWLWKTYPKQILIHTQSLVCFPWTPHRTDGGSGCNWDSGEALVSQRHYTEASSWGNQAGEVVFSSSLLCMKIRWKPWALVRCWQNFRRAWADFLARFSAYTFSSLSLSSIPGLEPGQKVRGGLLIQEATQEV